MPRKYWSTMSAQRVRQIASDEDIDRAIEKISNKLVEGLAGPPTDLKSLATRLDVVDIRSDDSMMVPGELRKIHGELIVFLLPRLTKTRRRFTLAHELGHAFFESTGRRPHPSQELEVLCDKFAAEFLMPRKTFISHAGRTPNLNRIRELEKIFQTSVLSTLSRAVDVFGYRAMEYRDGDIVWRRGMNLYTLAQVRGLLREKLGRFGSEFVYFYERGCNSRWTLEWETLGGEDHRIGLFRPD